jgi:FXSXX-COOH protein
VDTGEDAVHEDVPDDGTRLADLRRIAVADLPGLRGDSALEATLRRLQHEAETPQEAVSGFTSAI